MEIPWLPVFTEQSRTFREAVGHAEPTALVPLPPPSEPDPLAYLDEQLAAAGEILPIVPRNRPVWTFSPAAPDLACVVPPTSLTLRRVGRAGRPGADRS